METHYDIVFFIAGIFIGGIVGAAASFFIVKGRQTGNPGDLNQRVEFEGERSRLQAELQSARAALEEQKKITNQREANIGTLNSKLFEISEQRAKLETQLKSEIKNAAEKLAVINEAQQKMTDAFTSLSKQALDQNNQSFVQHAEQVFKRFQESAQADLNSRQEKISEIVMPVRESLAQVDSHISELERERLSTFTIISEQIAQMNSSQLELKDTASHLVNVLQNNKARGRWGEIQLRRVVEIAGMNQYCDFCEQHNVSGDEGRQMPDMIVNLPSERIIVIDAKAPMDSFLAAYSATDENSRKHHMLQHAKSMRRHVGLLSQKSYAENFSQSPEFVLMFLPNEGIYSAALEHDPELIEFGAAKNVIIATPSTLIALLKAAAYGWRQESVAKEVKQVGELGKQLYERLSKMTEHILKLGESLEKSVKNYNSMIGSIEGRVLTSARRFKDLQVIGNTTDDITALEPIETSTREFQAPEMKPPVKILGQAAGVTVETSTVTETGDLLSL
jgi:DNA recombination protein RmuC